MPQGAWGPPMRAGRASLKSYSAAISALGGKRAWQEALTVFANMHLRGEEPDVVCYTATSSACEKASEWSVALKVFHEMVANGILVGPAIRGFQFFTFPYAGPIL